MTVSLTAASHGPITADGLTPLPWTAFAALSADEIEVTLDGAVVSPANYGVVINGDGTGTITPRVSFETGEVYISSNPLFTQRENFGRYEPYFPDQLNPPLDRAAARDIYLKGQINRAPKVPLGEEGFSLPTTTERANKWAAFDSLGRIIGTALAPGLAPGVSVVVASRIILANLDTPSDGQGIWLSESPRQGMFEWREGDYSAQVTSDPLKGIYVPPTLDPSGLSGCWVRVWAGHHPDAAWWGAALDDAATDSAPALQACIDVTGQLHFPPGYYHGTAGLVANKGEVITGAGGLVCGYHCSHPTDHLLDNSGTTSAFAIGVDARDFALFRTVTPTTPASAADDRTQGHGIHLDLVSNPRVNRVYTYNNLVEVYVARTLAAQIENVRGLRLTGGAGDRWTGLMVYGDPAGMPDGWAGGPSGNPSCTIKKIQMSALAGLASSKCFSLQKNLQDLWLEDPEAGGGHVSFDIDPTSLAAGDVFIIRPVADAYVTNGYDIRNLPLNSTMIIRDAWVAPSGSATSAGVLLNGGHGLDMNVKGDFILNSGLRGVDANDCSQMQLNADMVNCQFPMVASTINSSDCKVRGYKAFTSANFGDVVTVINSNTTIFDICTVAVDTQKYLTACNIDNLSSGLTINVTRTYAGSAINKIKIFGSAVTTQGNVGGHVIINPGAGAML